MSKPWYKQKTFWASLGGVVTGITLAATGNVTEGVPLAIISLGQMFQRQATNNAAK